MTTMKTDPLEGIPDGLKNEIRQIWAAEVEGGRAAYKSGNSHRGRGGQWKISRLLKQADIRPKTDGRWEAVIEHGRSLYYGRTG